MKFDVNVAVDVMCFPRGDEYKYDVLIVTAEQCLTLALSAIALCLPSIALFN